MTSSFVGVNKRFLEINSVKSYSGVFIELKPCICNGAGTYMLPWKHNIQNKAFYSHKCMAILSQNFVIIDSSGSQAISLAKTSKHRQYCYFSSSNSLVQ